MTLDAVVVNVVWSMIAVSPLGTSIVPLLVKVIGSILSWPLVASASIVPLLVNEVPAIVREPLPIWSIAP